MLTELIIQNIVLIEKCELSFARGLCVLTGETGAGKSILLDALGLVLGARAESRLIRKGKDQAQVNATFDISESAGTRETLKELGLADADELIVRRVITADGKTRCFINDVAVSLNALKAVGDTLVEVHGQHDGRGLLNPAMHRGLLDAYGQLQEQCAQVAACYQQWTLNAQALSDAQRALEEAAREKEYLQHMQKELGDLSPEAGEEETLAHARNFMMQSEKLAQLLQDAKSELASGKGAMAMMSSAQRMLSRSSLNVENRFGAVIDALEAAAEKLGDGETHIEKLIDACTYDPHRLEQMEERLFALRGAARKYQTTVDGLNALYIDVTQKLNGLTTQQHRLRTLEEELNASHAAYINAAQALSAARRKAATTLEKVVTGELASLKMAATGFAVSCETHPEEKWSSHGIDAVQFLAATHKGASLAPLHKIASGGELSRFMLAMKVALAQVKSTATIIFDEIDTGTGGAVADAIGQRLARLGDTHQVLVVTHLPQVAARGERHLRILRADKAGATFTRVETLSASARQEELARMLSGAEVTGEARKAAQKLLQAAG